MPQGYCYLWNPGLVWLNAVSDGVIALSYYVIPLMLIYLCAGGATYRFTGCFSCSACSSSDAGLLTCSKSGRSGMAPTGWRE